MLYLHRAVSFVLWGTGNGQFSLANQVNVRTYSIDIYCYDIANQKIIGYESDMIRSTRQPYLKKYLRHLLIAT